MVKIKNLVKFCCFLIITIFLINKLGRIFIQDNVNEDGSKQGPTYTSIGFYKLPKNTIDVLFMGDSTFLHGISPMEIWHETGIISYNNSANSARTYATYYLLEEALKYQNPKLIVIDPDTMFYKYKSFEPAQRQHINYFKNNLTKLKMVNDPNYDFSFEDKVSSFIPLLRYHSRWNELKISDLFKNTEDFSSYTKGLVMANTSIPSRNWENYMKQPNKNLTYENNSYEYLEKIYKICQQRNIELFILQIPDSVTWGISQSNLIKEYADLHNIKFLDLNKIDIGIDWQTDSKDGGMHMNILGTIKVSNYIASYLKDNFNLPDHRDDSEYESWNADYDKYIKTRNKYVEDTNNIIRQRQ